MEVWKDIEGYEGAYQVSNYGNGRSLDRYVTMKNRWGSTNTVFLKGKNLVKSAYPNGYLFFSVRKNNITKQILIHRAVAKAFIPNPDNLPEVNHKDECKTNNVVCFNPDGSIDKERTNLEWCDRSYNSTYNDRHIKIGRILHNRPDMSKKVFKRKNNVLIEVYPSASEAARQNNIPVSNIVQCCNGGFNLHGKWIRKLTIKGYNYSYE